jgi:mannose-6-phosphate isomerase-like protein (cupin superfamily)
MPDLPDRLDGADKDAAVAAVFDYLKELGLPLGETDITKPWGAYFYIDPSAIERFCELYYPDYPREQITAHGDNLQPKVLLLEPGKRWSWQYHYRRAELWRVVYGPVGIVTSQNDEEGPVERKDSGAIVPCDVMVRHRAYGLERWGIMAEIWQHTDLSNPSDESDIVRLADDFGR